MTQPFQIERAPRHNPIPFINDKGWNMIPLRYASKIKYSETAPPTKDESGSSFSSTASRQASFKLLAPLRARKKICHGLYTEDQVVVVWDPPLVLTGWHIFIIGEDDPIRLERFGNEIPKIIYAGCEK